MRFAARDRRAGGRPDPDRPGGRARPAHGASPLAEVPARPRLRRLYVEDPVAGRELTRLGARLIAQDLRSVGINVDCLPVLDVPVEGAHDVIGDRAYSRDPATVAVLGRAAAEGLLAGGVLPVIKHISGHGRAFADSHLALPVVEAPPELMARDFARSGRSPTCRSR